MITETQAALPAQPIAAIERLQVVDILRGVAIFGILLVNMAGFSTPLYLELARMQLWSNPIDQGVMGLIALFAQAKFYTLFSFLFGFGFSILLLRAEGRGVRFGPLYVRRLLVLLLIGLAHATLFWVGDILVSYAILGFVLLLFRRSSPRTLLIWAGIATLVPLLLNLLLYGMIALVRLVPEAAAPIEQSLKQSEANFRTLSEQALRIYAEGNFIEMTQQRLQELSVYYSSAWLNFPFILTMFLLGLYAGRRGIFNNIEAHRPFIKRVMIWGLIIGLPLNLGLAMITALNIDTTRNPLAGIVEIVAIGIGGPALSLCYTAALTLLCSGATWQRRFAPIAAVGRMALSNYLLQTLICTTIFYSYGLGLYGQVGPALGLLLTVLIYAVQIPLSFWWLRHFRFGPVEWFWRSLTYGKWQSMRITRDEVAGQPAPTQG